jgi:hypothetical protein
LLLRCSFVGVVFVCVVGADTVRIILKASFILVLFLCPFLELVVVVPKTDDGGVGVVPLGNNNSVPVVVM